MTCNEYSKDVTEQYRTRYRGVVAAEKRGGEVLVLFDEGERRRGHSHQRPTSVLSGT
jgi:hypothetical protein